MKPKLFFLPMVFSHIRYNVLVVMVVNPEEI